MSNGGKKIRLSFNSPVILGFTLACFIVLILDKVTGSASTLALFSVYRSSLASPFTYIRFFGHVLGHASWDHFFGNICQGNLVKFRDFAFKFFIYAFL